MGFGHGHGVGVWMPKGLAADTPDIPLIGPPAVSDDPTGLEWSYSADLGVTQTGDGTDVTAWADQSSHGLDLATDSVDPSYVADLTDGKPAVYFDGSEWLTMASMFTSGFPLRSTISQYVFVVRVTDVDAVRPMWRRDTNAYGMMVGGPAFPGVIGYGDANIGGDVPSGNSQITRDAASTGKIMYISIFCGGGGVNLTRFVVDGKMYGCTGANTRYFQHLGRGWKGEILEAHGWESVVLNGTGDLGLRAYFQDKYPSADFGLPTDPTTQILVDHTTNLEGYWSADSVVESSGRISQINDLSGKNNHFLQSIALDKPVYDAAYGAFGGTPAVLVGDSDKEMFLTAGVNSASFTVLISSLHVSTLDDGVPGGENTKSNIFIGDAYNEGLRNGASYYTEYRNNAGGVGNKVADEGVLTHNIPYCLMMSHNGSTGETTCAVNGLETPQTRTAYTASQLFDRGFGRGTEVLDSDAHAIKEIALWSGTHTVEQMMNLTAARCLELGFDTVNWTAP